MRHHSRRTLLRKFRAAGGTAAEAWATVTRSTREAAKTQGWRLSELAATMADAQADLIAVYGKRAARAILGKDY